MFCLQVDLFSKGKPMTDSRIADLFRFFGVGLPMERDHLEALLPAHIIERMVSRHTTHFLIHSMPSLFTGR